MTTAKITYEFPANFYELPDDPRLEVAANLFLFSTFIKIAAEHLGQYCKIHIKLENERGYCLVQGLAPHGFVFPNEEKAIYRMMDAFDLVFGTHFIEPTYLNREIQSAIEQAKTLQRKALPHFNLDQEIEDLA